MSRYLLIGILMLSLVGCSSLLPSARQTTKSPWDSFDEAKASFDKIEVGKTTRSGLKELGFDPYAAPNIRILTYLDVMNRFLANPSIKKEYLDENIQRCIDARSRCTAYEFTPGIRRSHRSGNVILDIFNFKRHSTEHGWRFEALVVIIDDTVVYKLAGGIPEIDEIRDTKNPLGPLQSPNMLLIDSIKGQ